LAWQTYQGKSIRIKPNEDKQLFVKEVIDVQDQAVSTTLIIGSSTEDGKKRDGNRGGTGEVEDSHSGDIETRHWVSERLQYGHVVQVVVVAIEEDLVTAETEIQETGRQRFEAALSLTITDLLLVGLADPPDFRVGT
jgi:hypothetical protein